MSRRRTTTGRRVEALAVMGVVGIVLGVFLGFIPVGVGAVVAALLIIVDLLTK